MKIINTYSCVVFLGVLTSLILLTTAHAYDGEEPGVRKEQFKKNWEEKKAQMIEQLGLTEEQQQLLKAHKESHRGKMKELKEQIRAKREAMRLALQNADVDENTVRATNEEIKALMNTVADYRLDGVLELRKIFTPEQFKKFNELKEQHKAKWRGDHEGSDKE